MNRTTEIKEFFTSYADTFRAGLNDNSPDIERVAGFFADNFIAANPLGVVCGKNDQKFSEAIPAGYDFYKNIGITSMEIVDMEVIELNDLHAYAKVTWKSGFRKKDQSTGSIEFINIYFIQSRDRGHKIFGYIIGDEQGKLKESGLI